MCPVKSSGYRGASERATAFVIAAAFLFFAFGYSSRAAIVNQSGSLGQEIARLDGLVFPQNSHLYVTPNAGQLTAFRALATSVMNGSYVAAAAQAEALGYELVNFYDTETSHQYYLLREQLNAQGKQNLGWGNYIWNPWQRSDVLVEAPHPLYDEKTPLFAIDVYQKLGGRGFLMAGAHRSQDGNIYGIANVVSQMNSIFEVVHEAWSRASTIPIQIHGFDYAKHTNFPAGTDIVLSNGDGKVLQAHIDLDQAFEAVGIHSYVYNTLTPTTAVNMLVNGGVPGSTFSSLSADYNVQGQYTRNTYGTAFVHCEIGREVRVNDPNLWEPGVDAIAAALGAPVPEPAALPILAMGLAAGTAVATRRRLSLR
jgi:hypothetical protein